MFWSGFETIKYWDAVLNYVVVGYDNLGLPPMSLIRAMRQNIGSPGSRILDFNVRTHLYLPYWLVAIGVPGFLA